MLEFLNDASGGVFFWAIELTEDNCSLDDTPVCCFTLGVYFPPFIGIYSNSLSTWTITKGDLIFCFVEDQLEYVFEVREMMTEAETQVCLSINEPDGLVSKCWMTTVLASRLPFQTDRLYQDGCPDEKDQPMSDVIDRALRGSREEHTALTGVAWPFDFNVGCEIFGHLNSEFDPPPLDFDFETPPF